MISPLAYIHPNAKIGNDVTIEPFAVIHDKVTIGDNTHIMSQTVIDENTIIGKHCRIFPGAVIGAVPQDLKFVGEETTVEVGDYTTIRECVTINRGTKDRWKTIVGSHCLLMAYSHVAHDCVLGNYVILGNAVQLAGHVTIDNYAILSGMAGAHQFAHIGEHTYIAGHTVIRKDVPPFIKAAREPLSYMGINIVGLQRRGFTKEKITEISDIYHVLFVEKNTTSAAVQIIEKNFDASPIKEQILGFINTSKTGIIRRPSKLPLMQISLSDTGKRFNRDWVFRNLSYQFTAGECYAITGPNGSGKSTLLQVIAGAVSSSEGTIKYEQDTKIIEGDDAYQHISITAPYQELIEEMTLLEFLEFHKKFKPFLKGTDVTGIVATIGLESSSHKQIRYYSSGMKQRVKLAQAIFSNTGCLLLDEPCTNLDEDGIALYHQLINHYREKRMVIVSSNDRQEYGFCDHIIDILSYK